MSSPGQTPSPTTWMTWANLLTLIRLALIWPLAYSIGQGYWWLSAGLFAVAVVTDIFDGKLARRYHQASAFGGLFDHATDALFVTVGCWALAQQHQMTIVLPLLIPVAFIQYMLDSRALSGQSLRTSMIGRYNGVAYFVAIGIGVGASALSWSWLQMPLYIFGWVLCATTILSIGDRAYTLTRLRRR